MKQSLHSKYLTALALTTGICAIGETSAAETASRWRLSKALGSPEWLDVSGTHRTRYETLDGQFRVGGTGGDQMLAFRTTLRADVKYEAFGATAELMDSEQALADSGTPIDTTMVNAFELLQAYGSFRWDGPFVDESKSEIKFGRQTLDLGSRRLVARNSFRNTVNAFTGALWQWELKDGPTVRAFYFLPHNRLPLGSSAWQPASGNRRSPPLRWPLYRGSSECNLPRRFNLRLRRRRTTVLNDP